MTIKSNIKELTDYENICRPEQRPKIETLINIYKDRKIANFKTAFNTVASLASSNKNTIKRGLREYENIYEKYKEADTVTGLLTGPQFHTNERSSNYTNSSIKTSASNGTDLQTTF